MMVAQEHISDEQIIKALRTHLGMAYLAAESLGCDAELIRERSRRTKRIRAAMEFERGRMVNNAELKLYQAVQNGQAWAIQHLITRDRMHRTYNR